LSETDTLHLASRATWGIIHQNDHFAWALEIGYAWAAKSRNLALGCAMPSLSTRLQATSSPSLGAARSKGDNCAIVRMIHPAHHRPSQRADFLFRRD